MDPVAAHNNAIAAMEAASVRSTEMTMKSVETQGINQSNNMLQKAAESQTNNSNQGARAMSDTARA